MLVCVMIADVPLFLPCLILRSLCTVLGLDHLGLMIVWSLVDTVDWSSLGSPIIAIWKTVEWSLNSNRLNRIASVFLIKSLLSISMIT